MKKGLIIVIALLLALPAVSFAGSATSRWDLTIGGFVKFDAGYDTQAAGGPAGIEAYFPDRGNQGGFKNPSNEAGSFTMASGLTALNFLIKGPDAWGAKTSAFIQGAFGGQTTNAGQAGTRYGTYTLQLAYMDFNWAATKLTIGQAWQAWGFQPSYNFLGMYDLLMAGRGKFVPQITVTQNFTKSFYGSIGIQEPYNNQDQLGGSANLGLANPAYTLAQANAANANAAGPFTSQPTLGTRVTSQIPDFVGEIGIKSDACGKIGPNMMQFAFSGFWGQDTIIFPDRANLIGLQKSHVDRWALNFKGFIPIIPEKNLNKAGALSVSGAAFTGQNLSNFYLGARNTGAPVPYADLSNTYHVPVSTGGWGQISYYFTDQVFFNGLIAYLRNYDSNRYELTYGNQFKEWRQIIGNIMYDVNPAIRFGVEYTYADANWNYNYVAAPLAGMPATFQLDTKSVSHTGRVAFWYFF